jgi:hypothetical protein
MVNVRTGLLLFLFGGLLMGVALGLLFAAPSVPMMVFGVIFAVGKVGFWSGVFILGYLFFVKGPGAINVPSWVWLPLIIGIPLLILGGVALASWLRGG